MMVYLSPQVSENRIEYNFVGDDLRYKFNDEDTKTIHLPDLIGIELWEIEGFMPVQQIWRDQDGIVWVRLINFISRDASEEERFPDWFEV